MPKLKIEAFARVASATITIPSYVMPASRRPKVAGKACRYIDLE
jgi:hypothetical protein